MAYTGTSNSVSHVAPDYSGTESILKKKDAAAGQHLTGNLDFYTVTTSVDLTVAANLDKIVETFALRGQPVIMGSAVFANAVSTLKFANEHIGAWKDNSGNDMLANTLIAAGFANAVVTVNNGL